MSKLRWRACPTCGIAPARSKQENFTCYVCGDATDELWDKHQCGRHWGMSAKQWLDYNRLVNNKIRTAEFRPPRPLGYYPIHTRWPKLVWSSRGVANWKRAGAGARLDLVAES